MASASELQNPETKVERRTKTLMWSVLRFRDFRLFWAGRTISMAGDALQSVAVPWLVMNTTASGLALSTVALAGNLPRALLMLLGGVVVDRATPRTIIILSNLLRCVLVAAIAVLVATKHFHIYELVAIAIISGTTDAFSTPAFDAIPRRLVPNEYLMPANSILDISNQLGGLLGPALAGMFIAAAGTVPAFWLNSASFLIFALFIARLPRQSESVTGRAHISPATLGRDIAAGMQFVFRDPVIRAMFVNTVLFNMAFIGPVFIGVSLMAKSNSHGAATMGVLFSSFSAGALGGSFLAGWWTPAHQRHRLFIQLPILVALDLFAIAQFQQRLAVAGILFLLLGAYFGFMNVFTRALRQNRTPIEWQARVSSVLSFAAVTIQPVSLLAAGALAIRGATVVFSYAGMITLLTSAILACSGKLWRFN